MTKERRALITAVSAVEAQCPHCGAAVAEDGSYMIDLDLNPNRLLTCEGCGAKLRKPKAPGRRKHGGKTT